MMAWFIFWYLGYFEPKKTYRTAPKNKSCKNQPNSLWIHLFPPKFAAELIQFAADLIQTMFSLQWPLTILWNTPQLLQNCINCQKTECFMIFTCQSCILRCIGIFISLEYGKTGAVEKNCSCYCNILRQYSNWL